VSFEGTHFRGVTTLGQQDTSWEFVSSATTSLSGGYPGIPTSGRVWDPVAQANYCVNDTDVYSFQDTNSVKAIAAWTRSQGFAGIMIYDLGAGYDLSLPVPDAMLKIAASVMRGPIPGTTVIERNLTPRTTALLPTYPNPFNPATVISYQLSAASYVTLTVFDLIGREVETLVNARQGPGEYSVTWNAAGRASGVYIVRLNAGMVSDIRRMMLVK
jgi:hypothetical protein